MPRFIRIAVSMFGVLALVVLVFAATSYIYSQHVADYAYQLDAWPDRSDFDAPVAVKTDNPRRARILSIEGGALNGLADLEVLKAIEQRAGKPIHELFDFVAGSSTGAIIATMLLLPEKKTGKPMSAERAIDAYNDLASKVLSAPLYHKVLTGYGIFGPLLTNEGRIETSRQVFGDARFRDLVRPVMFPAYSQKTYDLEIFRNWTKREANLYLWSLLTAVTSVPAVFPAVALMGDSPKTYFHGDPLLILNEPADLAYLHARTHLPEVDEFLVVSLSATRELAITDDTGVRGGMLQWLMPGFQLLYRGERRVSQSALERHAGFESEIDVSVAVLSPVLPKHSNPLDPSAENRARLRQAGRDFVSANTKQIDDVVRKLTAANDTSE